MQAFASFWTKTTPLLKLPTVSSPALAGNKLVFGDGMHQTAGAFLHCLQADKGLPLWELPAPGRLVHLEGAPTVSGGRVYVGGGAAGVLCVDLGRVALEGKEMDTTAIQKILAARWKDAHLRQEALVDTLVAETEVIALAAAEPADADEMLADRLVWKLRLQHRFDALGVERKRRGLPA